jgi:UDPglucose--hexose-1-phosphate uridylyltransferase
MPATGTQEVIIETPAHDRDLPDLSEAELHAVVRTYHERFLALSEEACAARVFLFRNAARTPATACCTRTRRSSPRPRSRRSPVREIRMMGYHGDHGRCLLCALPEVEAGVRRAPDRARRALLRGGPWAAESAFEIWVVPRRHQSEFGECQPDELAALARHARRSAAPLPRPRRRSRPTT